MEILAYTLLGFAPGLFWLWYFVRKDDLDPEPRGSLVRVFLLGCASTLLVFGFYRVAGPIHDSWSGWRRDVFDVFVCVALVEETAKLAAFFLGAYVWREFDEPLDGVVYGIAAALGFASVENVLYLAWTDDPSLVVQRAFTAMLAHLIATGMLGFCFGVARFRAGRRRVVLMAAGIALAVAVHGLYDLLLLPAAGALGFALAMGLIPVGMLVLGLKIRWARARSAAYHPERTESEAT
jgi:RsiW-degrading membrane proteinase PrsW (M82 family)